MTATKNLPLSLSRLRTLAEGVEPGTSLSISDSHHLAALLDYLAPLSAPDNVRIQLLEAAMSTVAINLHRAPEKASAIAAFAFAIMRDASLQDALAEAEKPGDPSSIVEVLGIPQEKRCESVLTALRNLRRAVEETGLQRTELKIKEAMDHATIVLGRGY